MLYNLRIRYIIFLLLVSANSLDNHVSRVVELNEALSPIFAAVGKRQIQLALIT
ncbi:MAG TPA: hypothetical protein VGE40_15005 [Bacilli bacterium]